MSVGPDNAQAETVRLLADPTTHGVAGPVARIDTHISHLFLAGDRVFKLKRAVRFSYLDFSTVAARHRFCEAEITVNRRTAPTIYLGVAPIRPGPDGPRLGAIGEAADDAIDWVVVMRRFDQDKLFDRMAARGELSVELAEQLADAIATFHASAESVTDGAGVAELAGSLADIVGELRRFAPAILDAGEAERFAQMTQGQLARHAALLDRRARAGLVRRCHGDLHLRNICLIDGKPTPFDGIEFSEALSTIDVLYDLAFLLMDLEHGDLRGIANAVLNRYLWREGGYDGLAALPLFLTMRAGIRAHVTATQADGADGAAGRQALADDATSYLRLALSFGAEHRPRLIAIGGLSGTGKSALARALAPRFGRAPGAVVLRSDVIRKRLFGIDPFERLPSEAYDAATTARVYATLRAQAKQCLEAGSSVIADAVHGRPDERAAIEGIARETAGDFAGLWLDVPLALRQARIGARRTDASDATVAVARDQQDYEIGEVTWPRIDASTDFDESLRVALTSCNLNEKQ
ncbi:MAG: AAA family ATPase [Alphaproteobacteria bacterium]